MKAKEIFEKLGWKKTTRLSDRTTKKRYEKKNNDNGIDTIIIDKRGFGYSSYNEEGLENGYVYISMELLEAILLETKDFY